MEYKVLRSTDLDQLVAEVNSHIAEDWKLQGGISVCAITGAHEYFYYQAMTGE